MKNIFRRSHSPTEAQTQAQATPQVDGAPKKPAASFDGISFLDAIKTRRSIVATTKSSPISDRRVDTIVKHAVKHAPSAFSVDSGRTLTLFGADHDKLWDIALETCQQRLPPPAWARMEPRLKGFKGAYGTVLFFDDTEAVNNLDEQMQGLVKQNPQWYDEANGMLQFIVWTALATEGLGCSLQHVSPFVTQGVQKTWNVPPTWQLKAQLVFGTPVGPPRGGLEKQFKPVEPRALSFGETS